MKSDRISINRQTRETSISGFLTEDPSVRRIVTPIPVFSHFLDQLAFYSGLGLELDARDLEPADDHHVVEDTALAVGDALNTWFGDRVGRRRFGQCWLPMDDALALAVLDIGGRPGFWFRGRFRREAVGGLAVENILHFFRSFAHTARFTLHLRVSGQNVHHIAEALFKATGLALEEARQPWAGLARSTKGGLR
ncbi:MAG: imidazoleglycerol-phosphate dehydratase [Acidobacteria bacterium]|nr:imidazoleglycerol-phosphate dehydratase [Acidobacteriota bacterium]